MRIGVLGCADIARRRMLPAFAASDAVEVTAVASRDLAKAQETAAPYGCAAVAGYEAVLERSDVDAVYVPLPVALHAEWVERALLAGKHVLAEKPLTADLATTVRLVELAAEKGLVLRENFMFPFHGQHAEALSSLDGELIGLTAAFTVPPVPSGDIRHQRDLGGGALLDLGVYPLRTAQLFLGNDLEVVGARLRVDEKLGVDVAGAVLLAREDGVTAQLTFGMEHSYRSCYELVGSAGAISVDRAFAPPAGLAPPARLVDRDGVRQVALGQDDQYRNAVELFAAAVRTPQVRHGDAADTIALASLVEGVRRAAALERIPLP
ncbi:Gfo/Idh/MocA family protein [Lentzea cavernae]|uniref:Oxidoreductase n=1 Tax=Lentzea cavernae TaxID=2020703 RepID=A0ABQ3MMH8_9PSEU|nr:Gfo/Idh/MocA family oxidoreductase [Lentzea cavernae]GHH52467.1 oxidoreductase [Lentzea cavernae]